MQCDGVVLCSAILFSGIVQLRIVFALRPNVFGQRNHRSRRVLLWRLFDAVDVTIHSPRQTWQFQPRNGCNDFDMNFMSRSVVNCTFAALQMARSRSRKRSRTSCVLRAFRAREFAANSLRTPSKLPPNSRRTPCLQPVTAQHITPAMSNGAERGGSSLKLANEHLTFLNGA